MKNSIFITRRYRVSLSYIVNNIIQYIIPHNANLLDDYSSMDLLIDKSDTVGGSNDHNLPVNFTAVIDMKEAKMN